MSRLGRSLAVAIFLGVSSSPAHASFHLMEIEQVIGGVNGDTNAQAIQLRMRSGGQGFITGLSLVAYDASGSNPVTLITFPGPTPTPGTAPSGSRILVYTAAMAPHLPGVSADFPMTNAIPAAYLAAGSLTYESGGSAFFRLSWGGSGYTGLGSGSTFNDADGNYSPPFAGPLPSGSMQALLFQNGLGSSTNNAADFQLTPGAATFTNGQTANIFVRDKLGGRSGS